jgi:hypothetical protein
VSAWFCACEFIGANAIMQNIAIADKKKLLMKKILSGLKNLEILARKYALQKN